jgi:hypothetical protein
MQYNTEEIEISFRLDEEGRTIPSSTFLSDGAEDSCPNNNMDYSTRTVMTKLRFVSTKHGDSSSQSSLVDKDGLHDVVDELLLDAEISDCGLMPRTYWVPAPGSDSSIDPRCSLEQLALDVFRHHARPVRGCFDPDRSGAEWWVQIRPSPERTGRYAMLRRDGGGTDPPEDDSSSTAPSMEQAGISFHWDKDEDLRLLTGGNTFVHPHVSTVTYLTDLGAPTLAVNHRVHNLTGQSLRNSQPEAFVSWPAPLKHLAFDGRFLHSAPPDLMEEGAWQRQTRVPTSHPPKSSALSANGADAARANSIKRMTRRQRRVTFLVNIWLNYRPFNVDPFPDAMIDKMSGCHSRVGDGSHMRQRRVGISFPPSSDWPVGTLEAIVRAQACSTRSNGKHGQQQSNDQVPSITDNNKKDDLQAFTWPMGNFESGEVIRMLLPLSTIRSAGAAGGNVRIRWENPDDCLPVLPVRNDHQDSDSTSDEQKTDANGAIAAAIQPSSRSASTPGEENGNPETSPPAKRVKQ